MKYVYEQPEYLDIAGARHLVQELKVYIQEILNGNIDITQYATKSELSSAVSSIDLTSYAKTTDIPSLDGYATKSCVDSADTEVATGGEVDLSNYYNKQETDALIPDVITENEIKALFTTEGLATQTYVDNNLSDAAVDLTGYATETYVDNKVASVPTTDLTNYYTKTEVDTLIANIDTGGGEEGGGETTTPSGTSYISGNTTLKAGFTRTYTGSFLDAEGNAVSDVIGEWTITAPFADSEFTTKTITDNTIKLGVDNEDLIDETFTLTFSEPNGNYSSSSVEVTIGSAF